MEEDIGTNVITHYFYWKKKHLKCRLVGQQMNLSMLYSKQNLTLNLRYLFSSLDGKSEGEGEWRRWFFWKICLYS